MIEKSKNNIVFIISLIIAVIIIILGFLYSTNLSEISSQVMGWVSYNFGWLYILGVVFFIVFLLLIAFSKYGKIKLGKDDDLPKYSNFTWFAMLFCGATGIGLVFWSIAEPLSHFVLPPSDLTPGSLDAAEFSLRTCFLHWGLTQFACFVVVGLSLAYFQYRKGKSALISNLLEPIIGPNNVNGFLGKTIDIFSVVVTFCGVATSLGLGVAQICGGLNYLWDIPNNNITILVIILAITVIFLASAISGIDKGIKFLSSVNTYLALGLLTLAFIVGPKISILNTMISSVGQHIQYLISDLTITSAFSDKNWIMNWRVFYYAWFIAWCPFVGLFIARISRGRTIREFIIGAVMAPTIFTILWLSVFGSVALNVSGAWSLSDLANIVSHPETAVFIVFNEYPLSRVLSFLVIVLLSVFFITSADSATYSLSVMTSKGCLKPKKRSIVVWTIVESVMAYVLLSAGSLKPLQTISIAASLPFLVIMIVICFSVFKDIKKEFA